MRSYIRANLRRPARMHHLTSGTLFATTRFALRQRRGPLYVDDRSRRQVCGHSTTSESTGVRRDARGQGMALHACADRRRPIRLPRGRTVALRAGHSIPLRVEQLRHRRMRLSGSDRCDVALPLRRGHRDAERVDYIGCHSRKRISRWNPARGPLHRCFASVRLGSPGQIGAAKKGWRFFLSRRRYLWQVTGAAAALCRWTIGDIRGLPS